MQSQPCIVGTGPRTETCGGCFYYRYAPKHPDIDARWRNRCLNAIGHRAPRESTEPACPNFKPKV